MDSNYHFLVTLISKLPGKLEVGVGLLFCFGTEFVSTPASSKWRFSDEKTRIPYTSLESRRGKVKQLVYTSKIHLERKTSTGLN